MADGVKSEWTKMDGPVPTGVVALVTGADATMCSIGKPSLMLATDSTGRSFSDLGHTSNHVLIVSCL